MITRFIKVNLGFKLRASIAYPHGSLPRFPDWRLSLPITVESAHFGRLTHARLWDAIDWYSDRLHDPDKKIGLEAKRICLFLRQIFNREINGREPDNQQYNYHSEYFDSLKDGEKI